MLYKSALLAVGIVIAASPIMAITFAKAGKNLLPHAVALPIPSKTMAMVNKVGFSWGGTGSCRGCNADGKDK